MSVHPLHKHDAGLRVRPRSVGYHSHSSPSPSEIPASYERMLPSHTMRLKASGTSHLSISGLRSLSYLNTTSRLIFAFSCGTKASFHTMAGSPQSPVSPATGSPTPGKSPKGKSRDGTQVAEAAHPVAVPPTLAENGPLEAEVK